MEAEGAAGKADIRIKLGCQGKPHKFEILKARVKALRKRVHGARILCACVVSKLVDMERSVASMHASVFSSPRRLPVPYACNGLISQSSVQPHERSVTPPTNQPLSSCRKKSSTKPRCTCAMHTARNVYFRAQTRHCKGSLHGAGYPDGTSAPAGTTISVGSCRIGRQRCLFVPPTLKSDGGPSSTSSNGSSANAEECVASAKKVCA